MRTRSLRGALAPGLLVALAAAACAPAGPETAPAPMAAPADDAAARRAAADSAARARRDSLARVERREAERREAERREAARRDSVAAAERRAAAVPRPVPRRETPRPETPRRRTREAALSRPGSRPPLTPVPEPRREGEARVCAGGDVTLGTNIDTTWVGTASRRAGEPVPALPAPSALLRPLTPLVGDAEIVLVNVEAAIGDGRATRKCRPGSTACFALRSPASAAAAIRALAPGRLVVGNLANNHARDAGEDGFDRTREQLLAAGVLVTGADTLATPLVVGQDTIAVLGFGTSPQGPDARDLAAVRRHVRRAAERWGRVVVTAHIGAEGVRAQRTPAAIERYYGEHRGNPVAFARAAIDAGASLVVGHGPHVMRAMEWRGDGLIAYSLGNLVTHGPFLMNEPLNRAAVLCATIGRDGAVRDAVLQPTWQRRVGLLARDPSARALVLVDSLSRLDFPATGVTVDADGRVLR